MGGEGCGTRSADGDSVLTLSADDRSTLSPTVPAIDRGHGADRTAPRERVRNSSRSGSPMSSPCACTLDGPFTRTSRRRRDSSPRASLSRGAPARDLLAEVPGASRARPTGASTKDVADERWHHIAFEPSPNVLQLRADSVPCFSVGHLGYYRRSYLLRTIQSPPSFGISKPPYVPSIADRRLRPHPPGGSTSPRA